MTNKAQMLGMTRTTFRNANGLPDPKQRTTARDLATLSVALIRDFPQYYGYFKRTSFKYRGVTYRGHNKLLKSFAGYDGIKTGYIRASGFNLASSAERNGRRLVVVVLGGTSPSMRDRKVADLLTQGFKTQRGTGTLIAAKAPQGGQVKAAAPAPADTAAESVVEDVIANILIKPAQAASVDDGDEPMSAVKLAGLKGLAPLLKPGTRPEPKPAEAAIALATPALKPAPGAKLVKVADAEPFVPDTQSTTVVWKADGDYGIQVGAYSKYNAAQKAAQTATDVESRLLADARIIIDTQKMNNGSKLYRARVAGLSKTDAQAACRSLKAKRTDCLVLKIDPTLAMGN
jgi:D-alanyl-D-alanine carboxypeptidase